MQLSLLSVVDHYPTLKRSVPEFYEHLLGQIVLAEELGYQAAFVAEHHFHEYGAITNPAVFLAAAAQRTRRIRLGPSVSILPFHDPRTVAEDYVTLDILSQGRLILGLGSGYLKHEFDGYGVDPAGKRERFDEGMAVVERLIAGERVTHDGIHFKLQDVALNIRPVQKQVPIYVAGLRREVPYHIGKQGRALFTVPYAAVDQFSGIGDMAADFERGRAEAKAGPMPADLPPHICCLHTHVAETDAQAERNVREPFELYCRTRLYAKPFSYDDIQRTGVCLFGSVEHVADKIAALARAGLRGLNALQNFGAMPDADVRRSMTLMAKEVMPLVRKKLQ